MDDETTAPTPATTLKARFKGFALYHILYSFAFLPFLLLLAFIPAPLVIIPLIIFGVFSMLLYFPLGVLKAKRGRWTVPTRREAYLAILQPCAVSILWVMLFPLFVEIFQLYFLISALFAAPSSYFSYFLCMTVFSFLWGTSTLLVSAVLSAILPPLLFALGSFWQAKRQNFSP